MLAFTVHYRDPVINHVNAWVDMVYEKKTGQCERNEISVKLIDKTTEDRTTGGCVDYNLKIMDNDRRVQ